MGLIYISMSKFFITISICLVAVFSFLAIDSALAAGSASSGVGADIANQLKAAGETGAGYGDVVDPRITIALGIRVVLSLLGFIFACLVVYAGILWMTAGGKEEQLEKAKNLLFRAVIGLAIVLAAYSITWFATKIVFNYFDDPYTGGPRQIPKFDPPCEGLKCK